MLRFVHENDALDAGHSVRIEADDPCFSELSSRWGSALTQTFAALPRYRF